jgi:hypothetical protein
VITPEQISGAWRLVRWEIDYPGRGTRTEPFGPDAAGLLLYTPDGWMSAVMARTDRARFPSADMRRVSAAERAAAFDGYLHYAGRWRLEGDTVVHEARLALNPLLEHTVQRREARLEGGRLVLEARETLAPSGETRIHRIIWVRPGDEETGR